MKLTTITLVASLLFCCSMPKTNTMNYHEEVKQTETNFALMAKSEGIAKAFIYYAADEAVLFRNNQLIKGKPAIIEYFNQQDSVYKNIELTWLPDKVDVAKSGDLAYTYGKYKLINSTTGKVSEGIFHTVWKRQSDGQWRFVWD